MTSMIENGDEYLTKIQTKRFQQQQQKLLFMTNLAEIKEKKITINECKYR